jgi:hypothetical protein
VIPRIVLRLPGTRLLRGVHVDAHARAHGRLHEIGDENRLQRPQESVPLLGLRSARACRVDRGVVHALKGAQADEVEGLGVASGTGALLGYEHVDAGHLAVPDVVDVGHFLPDERLVAEVAVQEDGQPLGHRPPGYL